MIGTKMKKAGCKIKGSNWERDIAKFLSQVFGGNFMRSMNSGAYIGGTNRFRKDYMSTSQKLAAKGDIIPPDHLSRMVIEAKSYKDFPFNQLMSDGQCKRIDEWINQTLDCVEDSDVWFLIFKINNMGSYVCFRKSLYDNFVLGNHTIYSDYIITDMKTFFVDNKKTIEALCA